VEIFPAIDLSGGQCVRLTQGDFSTAKIYEADPIRQACRFVDAGAKWLHVVDLDGARVSGMRQKEVIIRIAKETPLKVQTGGGIRSEGLIEELLSCGVERVVVGSLAVKNKTLVKQWLRRFGGDHIVLAFDVRMRDGVPEVMINGWQDGSQQFLFDVLDAYEGSGLKHVLCTDVSQDGMLKGPNKKLYMAIQGHYQNLALIASGGVGSSDDLVALANIGINEVVVGKAIYENRIDLAEAIRQVGNVG